MKASRKGLFRRCAVGCCALFFSYPFSAQAEPIIPQQMQPLITALEAEKQKLQGGAFAIISQGQVVYQSTFGYQKGQKGLITPQTLFPLASVSKSVTAMAIALLVDAGLLTLAEKFALPSLKHPVSLTDVLSHTTSYDFSGNMLIEKGVSRPEILAKLKHVKPQGEPGTFYRYSNMMFSLCEEILKLKQSDLEQALQRLRETLKTDAIQTVAGCGKQDVAFPHVKAKNKREPRYTSLPFPPYYPKAAASAAGLFVSLNAMVAFLKMTLGHGPNLVSPKTLKSFHKPLQVNRDIQKWTSITWPLPREQVESFYGLGWRILKAKPYPGKDFIFHSGYIAGVATFVGFVPSADAGIIILLNQKSKFPIEKGLAFWKLFLP